MNKKLAAILGVILLAGCGGGSEAQKDYERCAEENSFGSECTREEFEDFLYNEAEYNQLTPLSEMTEVNQVETIREINDKIDKIFE